MSSSLYFPVGIPYSNGSSSSLDAFVQTIALRVILADKHRGPGVTLGAIIECKSMNGDALGNISAPMLTSEDYDAISRAEIESMPRESRPQVGLLSSIFSSALLSPALRTLRSPTTTISTQRYVRT